MRSTNLPLFDLFQRQRRYVVPLFQRPYVWSQERQWQPLWEDISDRAEDVLAASRSRNRSSRVRSHFLGAIVLNQVQSFGRQVPTDEVIEHIPIRETRHYVKRVLGTYQLYRVVWADGPVFPDWSAHNHRAWRR